MLRITVELIPWGEESKKKTIAQAEIWNTLDRTKEGYSYGYKIEEGPGNPYSIENQGGTVIGHNRNSSVWKLINRVIEDVFK